MTRLPSSGGRRCAHALVVVTTAVVLVGPATPVMAQSTPPTTASGLQDLVNKLLGGGTPPPPPPTAPAPSPGTSPGGQDPGAGSVPSGDAGGTPPADTPRAVPPEAQSRIDSLKRTPGRNTEQLLTALHQLVDLGLSPEEAAVIGMGQFPVAGLANYSDDFLFPRFNPDFRHHQGNDIFAAEGTPVRASADGNVRYTEGGISGKAYYLTADDGTYYFGCHLVDYADLPSGTRVTQGQIVGYVGSTGDAAGGPPHLHFEVHPGGGGAVNPKSFLDRWLDEALANVSNIVASFRVVGLPKAITYAGTLRRFDEPLAGGNGIATLIASSSSNPGIRRLSELRASRNVTSDGTSTDAANVEAWQTADRASSDLLARTTPPALQALLGRHSG